MLLALYCQKSGNSIGFKAIEIVDKPRIASKSEQPEILYVRCRALFSTID
tara:strand:+ start:101 stop:250 length:150 start_codon:yes stop_codon:yes gene_type:complete